jgi:hypothetical protein
MRALRNSVSKPHFHAPFKPNARIRAVRRLALAVIIGLLTFSTSGVYTLVINEPCTGYETPGRDDAACPPTCVTCGCCAQAVEPVTVVVSVTPDVPVADIPDVLPRIPRTTPRDILHVPKLRIA